MAVANGEADGGRPPRSISTQAVMLAGASAGSQVIVAVLYIFAARDSDPTAYGSIVTAIALGMVAVGFIDFGTNAFWTRELASGRLRSRELGPRVVAKLLITTGIATGTALLFITLNPGMLATAAILISSVVGQTMLVPLRALRRGETVALLLLGERMGAAVVFVLLILTGVQSVQALWMALALGTVTLGVAAFLTTPPSARYRLAGLSNPWRGANYYGLGAVAASGQQLDLPILSAIAGPAAAGIFGAVNRWTQPMGLLANSFASASAPFLAQATDWAHARKLITRAAWLLGLAITACVILFFSAPLIVPLLLGQQYSASTAVLQWLAIGTIPAILNQPLSSALQARRFDRVVAVCYIACVAIQLGLVLILGAWIGATGAAIAFAILQTLLLAALVSCLIYAHRLENDTPPSLETA